MTNTGTSSIKENTEHPESITQPEVKKKISNIEKYNNSEKFQEDINKKRGATKRIANQNLQDFGGENWWRCFI